MNNVQLLVGLMLLVPILVAAQKPAAFPRTMFVSFNTAPVYDSASYLAGIAGNLGSGDTVEVLGSTKKFFRIMFKGRDGFVLISNLAATPPRQIAREKRDGAALPSSNPDGRKSTAPSRKKSVRQVDSSGVRPPVSSDSVRSGATTVVLPQCTAITRSGKRCTRRAADQSGLCWQHRR